MHDPLKAKLTCILLVSILFTGLRGSTAEGILRTTPPAASSTKPGLVLEQWQVFPASITLKQGSTWQRILASSISKQGFYEDHGEVIQVVSRNKGIFKKMDTQWVAIAPGNTVLEVTDTFGNIVSEIAVDVSQGSIPPLAPSFVDDVQPILTKAGCNNGACHSKPGGRNGFELSVFGHAPELDYGEILHGARGRRIFPANPSKSLLLMKPMLQVPHEGGSPLKDHPLWHSILVEWIAAGMPYHHTSMPALSRLEIFPEEARIRRNSSFHLAVMAHYEDGSVRDVTHLAEYQSTDKDFMMVDHMGQGRSMNRDGRGVVVARFSGLIAESQWIVPRSGHEGQVADSFDTLPENNFVDTHAHAYLKELGYLPSGLCTDEEFIRRSSLDAVGVLPTTQASLNFLADKTSGKRKKWIRQLLKHRWMGDYWANQWADLLRPNTDRAGIKSVYMLDQWIRECFRKNMPYDAFVREILTLEGSNHKATPASIYRDKRTPEDLTVLFSQVFLGVRLECAKCHHHPFEKWGQEDFYQAAAHFGSVKQKGAGVSPPISAGTETFFFRSGGQVKHPRTGEVMQPMPPGGSPQPTDKVKDPRGEWMTWMLDPENPYFARAIVNRVWSVFFGRGFVHPVDDFRTSNPPVHEPLLQALSEDFIQHGYDLRHLMATIMESRLYQLSSSPNRFNAGDTRYFSRYYRKRLPAEVLLDAVSDVTGIRQPLEGLPPNSRAVESWNFKINSQFMDAFDRPNSSSDPPCVRINRPSVVQALHMMHSEDLQKKLQSKHGWVEELMQSGLHHGTMVEQVYLKLLSRYPTPEEKSIALKALSGDTPREGVEDILWALLNSAEFVFNH
ncbi:DUF1549 and DUF1553 domain-containing protein [Verrucomicrobia bacterium]|nr:DUF1549 and DUF1553 domain-containing protein [Verrucomicrobiota bacterium]